ncbi:MAG TPA: FxLYD domain-containing protein [Verrucomicrobiae bacterium]|nr:FxLYD domain-containing protein [Verrucomicrobiae bacterium]
MTLQSEHNPCPPRDRICPFCAETIKREAKVCPRCRQWLTLRSLRNPAIAVWVYGLPHLMMYAVLSMTLLTIINRFQNPKPDYSDFLNSVRVLESRMNCVQTSTGTYIYITGILTNQSEIGWKDIELECRFFDQKGALLDAAHPHEAVTVQPHDDTAFRVTVTPARATNDYASFRLVVTTARNTKGLF